MTPIRLRRGPSLALLACALISGSVYGQTIQPSPPKDYDVQLRFRIRAPQPAWFDRFDELQAFLKGVGFTRSARPEDEPEDVDADVLTGTIASENARKMLVHPFVQTILLSPRGYKLPDNPDARVKVNLTLATGLPPDRQRVFSDQALGHLTRIGFRDAVGYDHRGHTRLFGTINAGNLGKLLRDLRTEPAGWLVPMTPVNALPSPLRNTVPVRVIEMLPEPSEVAPAQEPPAPPVLPEGQAHLAKVAGDLRNLIALEKDEEKLVRLEVVLAEEPREGDRTWEREIRNAAVGTVIEGRIGPVATVVARVVRASELARPRAVLALRLPRSGEAVFRPADETSPNALVESRVTQLHQKGHRGGGVKVAVISGDFGGYRPLLGNRLGKNTPLVDFTTARNPSLNPDPMPSDDGTGQGTLCALAVRAAAPNADIVLVRIDPTCPSQLLSVARLLNGETPAFETYEDRMREIGRDGEALLVRRRELQEERRKALDNIVFEEGNSMLPELRKKYEESQARLKKVMKDLEGLAKSEAELQERTHRFMLLRSDLAALGGVRVAVCPLVWGSGHALDGASELSRYFDERFSVPTAKVKSFSPKAHGGVLWVQAAGDTRGQTWSGLFRDDDGNGALEFAPFGQQSKKDRWTPELNFLAWQPFGAAAAPDLPEKARVRVSIQWREPHDRDLSFEADDPYREPLANLGLVVVKQRDPTGTKLATDDLDVVARSSAPAVRLRKDVASGTYEQLVEFDVISSGRYAVRVEGRIPESNRPAGSPTLPSQRRGFEVRPRLIVEVLDAATQAKGRVVFADYSGAGDAPSAPAHAGGVGMPADARNVLTVGAADAPGKPSPASSMGAGPGRELMTKPDVLGPSTLDLAAGRKAGGTAIAAAFDAGVAACLVGRNVPAQAKAFQQLLHLAPTELLRVPADWGAR